MRIRPIAVTLREDEIKALEEYAETLPHPYTGRRAAAMRECLRLGMERVGIDVDPLRGAYNA